MYRYVDKVNAATALQSDLIAIQSRVGMLLKKWASTREAVIDKVFLEDEANISFKLDDSNDPSRYQ